LGPDGTIEYLAIKFALQGRGAAARVRRSRVQGASGAAAAVDRAPAHKSVPGTGTGFRRSNVTVSPQIIAIVRGVGLRGYP
jgi:hypothetical protein